MKLFRLVLPILAGLAMAAGTMTALAHTKTAPASLPAPIAIETDLRPTGGGENLSGAENMHADSKGRLWISQDADGPGASVRLYDPATHAYTDYTGLTSPNDAQLGPDGYVWWNPDQPFDAAGLARMDLASRTVTTWSVPLSCGASLAFDNSNKVWALDCGTSSIFNFAPISHTLCSMPLPNGSSSNEGTFLTEHGGALWLGLSGVITPGLARITPTTNAYTFWPLSATGFRPTPSGVSFAPDGVMWFSDEVSGTIGRLETGANRVTLFNPPGGYTPQKVDFFLGKVWFTGQNVANSTGTIGFLDPATATPTATTPLVVTPTTALLSPVCVDAGPGFTFTAGISTGTSIFTPLPLTTTVDAQGIAFGTPISSQPAALVRYGTRLWMTDEGRNKLIEVVITTTNLYLPFMRR